MMNNLTTIIDAAFSQPNYSGEYIHLPQETQIEGTEDLLYLITPLALKALKPQSTTVPSFVSPVTLSSEWPRLARLILLSILSVIGTVGNVFMISSPMIVDPLKKAGNAFIVNIALSDLLVTSILMPISIIVILSGNKESLQICKVQWFLAACSFLISVLTLAITSIENYMRLCTSQEGTQWFGKTNVTAILLIIWFIGLLVSALHSFTTSQICSFDYCERSNANSILKPYETVILFLLIVIPLALTVLIHIRILVDARKFMRQPNFKPNGIYKSDCSLARSNFISFLTFVLFWLPFTTCFILSTTVSYKNVSDRVFYTTAWIGLSKSCFHNIIYCITNRHFRHAYVNLFNYCCCKTTVSVSRRIRNDVNRTTDVRVHIIPGYNIYTSPQRATSGKRDCHDL